MNRRDWIKQLGAVSAFAVPNALLGDSFNAANVKPDTRVELLVPEDAANGAVVPVSVESSVPGTLKIVLLVDNHARSKIAELDTSNPMLVPKLSTHLQLQNAATITALVETKSGWHGNSVEVKTLGESCES